MARTRPYDLRRLMRAISAISRKPRGRAIERSGVRGRAWSDDLLTARLPDRATASVHLTVTPHNVRRYLRIKKMITTAGITMKNPPANRKWSGAPALITESTISAGNVRWSSVRIVAANTSFHDSTKVKMAAPG